MIYQKSENLKNCGAACSKRKLIHTTLHQIAAPSSRTSDGSHETVIGRKCAPSPLRRSAASSSHFQSNLLLAHALRWNIKKHDVECLNLCKLRVPDHQPHRHREGIPHRIV